MGATIVAVIGTLLGAVIAGAYQQHAAGRTERLASTEQLARDRREAITALSIAISDHRSMMYRRCDAALRALPADRVQELRDASHQTRAAVTRPLVTLRLLITDQTVRTAADLMVTATYAMRDATDRDSITAARQAALIAHDAFVDHAAHYLTNTRSKDA